MLIFFLLRVTEQIGKRLLPVESCNFENLLQAKWSNFANTQKIATKFSGMLGEDEQISREKLC